MIEVTQGNGWGTVERAAQHGDVFCRHLIEDYDAAVDGWQRSQAKSERQMWGDMMDRLTAQADTFATYKRSQV
jgi:hypothetical protein